MNSNYSRFVKPLLGKILTNLKLDYEIISGKGINIVVKTSDGKVRKVLDLICGYGSCLLGHNYPVLVNTLIKALQKKSVANSQLSLREKSGLLARELNIRARKETGKLFNCVFANSGAEAVESAMKHALLNYELKIEEFIHSADKVFNLYESQRQNNYKNSNRSSIKTEYLEKIKKLIKEHSPVFIALEGAFHGKTLGASSITDNKKYTFFSNNRNHCYFINPSNIDTENIIKLFGFGVPFPELLPSGDLKIKEKTWLPITAIFAEPIQGEAGVFPLSNQQARSIRTLCDTLQIPLVWDEIQSGSYRTGKLFFSSRFDVKGDYYLLGKSLGGGISKTSVLMIEQNIFIPEFDIIHTSTFAEDELSSMVAYSFLKTVSYYVKPILLESKKWKNLLSDITKEFPKVIKEVRGEGLLLAIEFKDFYNSSYYGLQSLSRGGYINYLLAAWIFNHYHIRVSAPLSNSHTIRLHPPVGCSNKVLKKVKNALKELCRILEYNDMYSLISFLLPVKWQKLRKTIDFSENTITYEIPEKEIPRVGFITHYIDKDTLLKTDPSFKVLPIHVIEKLLERFQKLMHPVITGSRHITVSTGEKINLTMIGVPFTARMAKNVLVKKSTSSYKELILKSIKLLEDTVNPSYIGLGQYTSVISLNGLTLSSSHAKITTGNGLTAFLAVNALISQCKTLKIKIADEKLAIIGAAGNIGTLLCKIFLLTVNELLLVGNPLDITNNKLVRLKKDLEKINKKVKITIAHNIKDAKDCRLVIVATNQPSAFLDENKLHPEAIICDLSLPHNVCRKIFINPDKRIILPTGVAYLPDGKPLPTKGFPLPDGQMYGCLAETLVLGLAKLPELTSLGTLKIDNINKLGKLASKYGFIKP